MSIKSLGLNRFAIAIVILTTIFPISHAQASEEMLWGSEDGYVGARVNPGTDVLSIPLYARLRDITFSVPKVNPDVLILGIRFDQSFDSKPLAPDKKMTVGFRLFAPSQRCIYEDLCTKYLYATLPSSWSAQYPTSPAAAVVQIYSIGTGDSDSEFTDTNCPAPWWVDKSNNVFGTFKFQLSITCLGIPKSSYAYSFAATDIGLSPIPYNFTGTASIENPYWQLAASAYKSQGELNGVGKPYTQIGKKQTITCTKGKITKSIKGLNPVCPKGYKKK